jgi:hypothetical protein
MMHEAAQQFVAMLEFRVVQRDMDQWTYQGD